MALQKIYCGCLYICHTIQQSYSVDHQGMMPFMSDPQHPLWGTQNLVFDPFLFAPPKIGCQQPFLPPPNMTQKPQVSQYQNQPPWSRRMEIQHDPYNPVYGGYGMQGLTNHYHMYDMARFCYQMQRSNQVARLEMLMMQDSLKSQLSNSTPKTENTSIRELNYNKIQVEREVEEGAGSINLGREKIEMLEEDDSKQQKLFNDPAKTKQRNQTKNIPKNYGKAMISFILERSDWIKRRLGSHIHNQLIAELKDRKGRINSIIHLKDLWTNSKYSTQFRILSNLFLRKHSFSYIFNSRVSNFGTHIKYKYKLSDAVRRPAHFKSIKEY